jgi:hypothetical protein
MLPGLNCKPIEKIGRGSLTIEIQDNKPGFYSMIIATSWNTTLNVFWNNNPKLNFIDVKPGILWEIKLVKGMETILRLYIPKTADKNSPFGFSYFS